MLIAVLIVQGLILVAALLYFLGMGLGIFTGAPYVGTNPVIVRAMLAMAKVTEKDTVIDLGCGVGNILWLALKEKQVRRVIGYDMNPILIALCHLRFSPYKKQADFFVRSIEYMNKHPDVTVVTLYLLPNLMNKIAPVLAKSLPSTARIIAHGFAFKDIEPVETQQIGNATLRLYAMSDLIAAHTI